MLKGVGKMDRFFTTLTYVETFHGTRYVKSTDINYKSHIPAASFLAEAGELAAFLGDMTLCNAAAFLALLVFTVALDGDLGVWMDDQNMIQI